MICIKKREDEYHGIWRSSKGETITFSFDIKSEKKFLSYQLRYRI